MKQDKRGVAILTNLPAYIMALVLVGVFLSIGAMVVKEFQEQDVSTVKTRVDNESFTAAQTWQNQTYGKDTTNVLDFQADLMAVSNGSTNTLISEASAWNMTNGFSRFALLNASNTSRFNITYDYTQTLQDHSFNSTKYGLMGMQNLSTWQLLIAIVLASVVVIGIVFYIRQ